MSNKNTLTIRLAEACTRFQHDRDERISELMRRTVAGDWLYDLTGDERWGFSR